MWVMNCAVLVILGHFLCPANGAKILAILPTPSYSHQVVFQPIYRELSLRGHQVTVYSPNLLNDPTLTNLTEIDGTFLYKHRAFIDELLGKSFQNVGKTVYKSFEGLMDILFNQTNFREIFNRNKNEFDLIIVEAFSPILYGLAAKFDAPVVGILSLEGLLHNHMSVGNPTHPFVLPDVYFPIIDNPTILQKIYYVYEHISLIWYYHFEAIPNADAVVRRYLGDDLPYLGDLANNVSLLLLNTNSILHQVRPSVPNVVSIGFVQVKPPKPLPTDLQVLLDNAKNGVIYLSLGSNIKSSFLPKKMKEIIIKALSELPYTVLWKWETDNVPNLPPNVITRKWLPQPDLLAHPNIKAFVTQGGLQSFEESISRGVPMVAMPFFCDQDTNTKKLVEREIGLRVEPNTMTKEQLRDAIIEVVTNDKYRRNVEHFKRIVYDQPMTPLERSVWWIEHVIRHKGAKHLRSRTADVSMFDYLLLDVVAVLIAALLITTYLLYKIFKFATTLLKSKGKFKLKKI